jgi:hypothetical protein
MGISSDLWLIDSQVCRLMNGSVLLRPHQLPPHYVQRIPLFRMKADNLR